MRRHLILITSIFISLILNACAYQPDVQQGNAVDDEQIAKLKIGMTKQQVKFVLGSALLTDPFHHNRWDYVFTFRDGQGKTTGRVLTLFFKQERLDKIDTSNWDKRVLQEAN